ncbi:MAG TPA: AI-2E family transporter YdiK, partial [Burkholderiales bacterium]|nr:AI-2E family transporter YdiK [Burkholderiales bacterium]
MNSPPPSRDLARITLAVLVIGLMIVACLWILQPFLGATIWATMIVVATWPLMLGVQARLGGRRWAAVTVMTVVMLLVLVVPIVVAVATIVDHADDMVAWAKALAAAGIPSPPGWLQQVPFIGERMAKEWQQLAATPPADLVARATPYARQAVQWFAARAGGFGLMMLQFLLIVIITAI